MTSSKSHVVGTEAYPKIETGVNEFVSGVRFHRAMVQVRTVSTGQDRRDKSKMTTAVEKNFATAK